jgi:hypothetical protein
MSVKGWAAVSREWGGGGGIRPTLVVWCGGLKSLKSPSFPSTKGMSHLKIINASQGSIHEYENVKRKIYNCNASIYFNKQCLLKKLIPTYARIRIPNISPAAKFTQRKVQTIRTRDGLKYLHMKKQQTNQRLYHLHLLLANSWGNSWEYILDTINKKLDKLTQPR